MSRCVKCGAELEERARFCAACELRRPAPSDGLSALDQPADETLSRPRWHRGRRVVLTFLAVITVLATAFVIGVVYFIRDTTIVTSTKNGSRYEAPFGVVTTTNDPQQMATSLGIEVFPGATGEKSAQAEMGVANMVSLSFHTTASPRQVIEFYHVRFPDATVKSIGRQITLVQIGGRDTLTIKALPLPGPPGHPSQTSIEISDIRR